MKLKHFFAKPEYESEFTLFLNEWKQRDSGLQERQSAGLALLWNKQPIDQDERLRDTASAVKRLAYVYE